MKYLRKVARTSKACRQRNLRNGLFTGVQKIQASSQPIAVEVRIWRLTEKFCKQPDLRELMYTDHVTIYDNVWIGENVTICPGVTIGENSVIGAVPLVFRRSSGQCGFAPMLSLSDSAMASGLFSF